MSATRSRRALRAGLRLAAAAAALLVALPPRAGAAADLLDCYYQALPTPPHPQPEIELHPRCAKPTGEGTIRVEAKDVRALDFGSGLAVLNVRGGGWYYVKPDGTGLAVLTLDNGPDPFAENLVRARRHGKVAFFDRSFRMVLPPRYDFAWPFEGGLALVCSGCAETPHPHDSEHVPITGGLWGYIDHRGREIVPVRYSRDQAAARKDTLPHP